MVGYKYYFRFVTPYLRPGTECIDTGMKRERIRAEQAFELAEQGKTVCVISSGDVAGTAQHARLAVPDDVSLLEHFHPSPS